MKSILLALMLCVAVVSLQAQSPTPDQLLEVYRSGNGRSWSKFNHPNGTVYDCIDRQNGNVIDWAVNELHKRAKGQPI